MSEQGTSPLGKGQPLRLISEGTYVESWGVVPVRGSYAYPSVRLVMYLSSGSLGETPQTLELQGEMSMDGMEIRGVWWNRIDPSDRDSFIVRRVESFEW